MLGAPSASHFAKSDDAVLSFLLLSGICSANQDQGRCGSGNEAARMGFTIDQRNNLSREMITGLDPGQLIQVLAEIFN